MGFQHIDLRSSWILILKWRKLCKVKCKLKVNSSHSLQGPRGLLGPRGPPGPPGSPVRTNTFLMSLWHHLALTNQRCSFWPVCRELLELTVLKVPKETWYECNFALVKYPICCCHRIKCSSQRWQTHTHLYTTTTCACCRRKGYFVFTTLWNRLTATSC